MKLKCLKYHNRSGSVPFRPGRKYSVSDDVAAELLKDFPERFVEVQPIIKKVKDSIATPKTDSETREAAA